MNVTAPYDRESASAFEHMLHVEISDVQARYQRLVLVLLVVIAWLAAVRYTMLAARPGINQANLPALICVLAVLVLAYALRTKPMLSLFLSLGGLILILTVETAYHPGSPSIYLFGPAIVLVSAVASASVLVLAILLCGGVLATLASGNAEVSANILAPVIALAGSAVCAWIASRPSFDSLSMALYSAQDSIRARDDLREQRRQLAASVKALDEALYRVGRLNASLVIARQQADEARQLKVRFANMISHEMRTPLNIIISFSEVIANAPESYGTHELPPSLREDVTEIYRSGKHLLGLINDVLDLAQIEVNRVVLKKEQGDLLEVVEQAVSLASKWFDHAGLYLRVERHGDIPELTFDRIRIRQVVLNLLSNARHYTAQGGVVITLERLVDEVLVKVKDSGLGISEENLRMLFEEFHRFSDPVDESVGSGLGLAISRMFIELHGGRMWAESSGIPGEGTTVAFSLPLPSANLATDIPASAGDAKFWQSRYDQARSERVLLVAADDSSVIQMANRLLTNQGKIVNCSLGGIPQVLPVQQPDVVVAFHNADQTYQANALRTLHLPTDTPLITCSLEPNLEGDTRITLSLQDVNTWLLKPVTREELASAVVAVAPAARLVLSVEDDLAMARFYELALTSDQRLQPLVSFTNVTGIHDAAAQLVQQKPDVVLVDMNLTDGTGWDVLAMVRARWTHDQVPVIIVTAMDRYGLPMLRAQEVTVRRAGGLTQRQTLMCLQNTLESVLD